MYDDYRELILDICKKLDIKVSCLSNNWIFMLEKNNKTRFITGFNFGLDSHTVGNILDDKFATYDVLKHKNIPVVEHNLVYSSNNKNNYAKEYNSYSYVLDLFNKYNRDIVLKINSGSCGVRVYHICDEDKLKEIFSTIGDIQSFSLSPYMDIINEYRVIVLNGEVRLFYKKYKPSVIGNGVNTINELFREFNYSYFKDIDISDDILEDGKIYEYDWKFNLSRGGIASLDIDDNIKKDILDIALNVQKIINLQFGSIDVIKTKDSYYILEINGGVMMRNILLQKPELKKTIESIYMDAIKLLMED